MRACVAETILSLSILYMGSCSADLYLRAVHLHDAIYVASRSTGTQLTCSF